MQLWRLPGAPVRGWERFHVAAGERIGSEGERSTGAGGGPARNLTPVPSPIALPPTGRGGLGWSDRAYRVSFPTINDFKNASYEAPSTQTRPPRPDGGRAREEGTGVRFRAGAARAAPRRPL